MIVAREKVPDYHKYWYSVCHQLREKETPCSVIN